MKWLHPITLEEEVSVYVKIAAVIAAYFGAKSFLYLRLVEVLADPAQCGIA